MASKSIAASVAATAAAIAVAVLAPSGQAQLPACPPGATNQLYCQTVGRQQPAATTVRGTNLSALVCRLRTAPLRIVETITAPSGIRRVTVTLDGRRIKSQRSGHVSLRIALRRLRPSVAHAIKISILDGAGRTIVRTLRFRVCPAARLPVFTG